MIINVFIFIFIGIPEQNKIIEELDRLYFPRERRVELGKHLGIPPHDLQNIERREIGNIDSKRAVLSEMVYYWFERSQNPSYSSMVDILNTKMHPSMDLDGYEKRVVNGEATWSGSYVEASNIQEIITKLGHETIKSIDLLKLAKKLCLDLKHNNGKPLDGGLYQVLLEWIHTHKENATWGVLIKIMKEVNKEAAMKIEEMGPKEHETSM